MAEVKKSARKQIAAILAQIEILKGRVAELQPQADLEPAEFDGTKVPVGANVIIATKAGNIAAKVLAKKAGEPGVKGPGLMYKVQTGTDFDVETRVVYPGQIVGYNNEVAKA